MTGQDLGGDQRVTNAMLSKDIAALTTAINNAVAELHATNQALQAVKIELTQLEGRVKSLEKETETLCDDIHYVKNRDTLASAINAGLALVAGLIGIFWKQP